jgi:hypothetical protein
MNTVIPTQRFFHCHIFLLSSDPIPTHLLNINSNLQPYQVIMNSSTISYTTADVLNVLMLALNRSGWVLFLSLEQVHKFKRHLNKTDKLRGFSLKANYTD